MSTKRQSSEPSPGVSLPSSHCSPGSTTPLPQRGQSGSAPSRAPSQSLSTSSRQEISNGSGGLAVGTWVQPETASQESSVQTFESSQLTSVVSQAPSAPALQNPARHLFSTSQLRAGFWQLPRKHASSVQGSPSAQS